MSPWFVATPTTLLPLWSGEHLFDGDAFDDAHAEVLRAPRKAHRQVDGIDPAVPGDIETSEEVIGLGQREQVGHLPRAYLVDLQAQAALEGRNAAILLQPV